MTTKRTVSANEIYSEGRRFPRGQARDPGARERIEHEPSFETGNSRGAFNSDRPQDPSDFHDRGYSNDCEGWVRGAPTGKAPSGNNETAEDYPQGNFDKGQSYRRADKGNDWNSGSDKVEIRKGGDENEWAARSKKS